MLENGEIKKIGTFEQLKNDQGLFADFIKDYSNSAQMKQFEVEKETQEIEEIEETSVQSDLLRKASSVKDSKKPKVGEKIISKEKIESGTVRVLKQNIFYILTLILNTKGKTIRDS